jgi:glycosyltransferase involved in cell wall biosynthesis
MLARSSDVVHAGVNDLYQPYSYVGFKAGLRAGAATVFVQDTDMVRQLRELARGQSTRERIRLDLYARLYGNLVRRSVARADLSLLKGRALHERYGRFARNARDFYDTSYRESDIIPPEALQEKCRAVANGEPLRCLALGRLVARKSVDQAIRATAQAARSGTPILLDVVGDGPEETRLRRLADEVGGERVVRFLGAKPYDSTLLREIAAYHVLLFTSVVEDTPRSVFDALAGGCALLGYDIPYNKQVTGEFGHGLCVRAGSIDELAGAMVALHHNRQQLVIWMRQAAASAPDHCAERWYQRRAEWTMEAFECSARSRRRRGTQTVPRAT